MTLEQEQLLQNIEQTNSNKGVIESADFDGYQVFETQTPEELFMAEQCLNGSTEV